MMRYLYTLAAYSKADTVLPTLAILSPVTDIKYSASEKANALELIDVSLRDRKLAAAVDEIFNEREKKFTLSQEERDNFLDPSLRELVSLTESDLQKPENLALFKLLQLRKTLLFSKLPSEVLHQVAEKMTLLTLGVGETLFKQGDVGSGLYIVVSGKIDLIKNNVKLPAAKPYQLLGELALIDKKPRAATAVAAVNSTLFFLEKSAFDELLEENPDLLRALAQVIMHYLRKPAAVVEGE
jgi:CRP/FNR family transcriptional regulator, cyclic AMP receptor protein